MPTHPPARISFHPSEQPNRSHPNAAACSGVHNRGRCQLCVAFAGGDFRNVFRWVIHNGIDTDADWPYEAEATVCHNKRVKR